MDFYEAVTAENAQGWYEALPAHLKKNLDSILGDQPKADVHTDKMTLDPTVERMTEEALGYSLPLFVQVNRGVEGNMPDEIARFDLRHKWCKAYNDLTFVYTVTKEAPRMQRERKMLSQALGLKQGGNGLPSQAEGLDDTQAATVRWLQSSGETPLEFLTSVYRDDNPDVRTSDKIAAARALLDYVHRKVPAQVEVKGPSSEDIAETSAIVREMGDYLAQLAALNKKQKS